MAGSTWRKTDSSWERIKSIWRKTDSGWERIKSVWRKTADSWERVFGTGSPSPKSDVNLWFIDSPYDSGAFKSTEEAFQNSKMYIQRGKWENDPVYFEVRIQKKPLIGEWELLSPPGINTNAFTYLANQEYSDNDFEKIWPTTSSNWPMITLNDIKNKIKFRAKIKVFQSLDFTQTELDQLEFHFPSDLGIAPRLGFDLNPFDGESIAEYPDLTNPALKQYGIKWRYNTSYFSEFDAIDVIGRQIIEVTDYLGNIVIQPFEVPVGSSNPQLSIINYTQAMIDSGEEYIIKLYVVAEDYYYNGGLTLEQYKNDNTQTIKLFSATFQPPILVEDPTITITSRDKSSFNVQWNSPNAERYYVDIKSGGSSIFGYPKTTTDTAAFIFGRSENERHDIYVTALAGVDDKFKSNIITKCVRTLTTGIPPILGEPYGHTSNSFKIDITNYAFIDSQAGWDVQVNATNGNASRNQQIILVSNVSSGLQSCVTATSSNIDNVDLCRQSWEQRTSNTICETIGNFYCIKTGPADFCTTFNANYDASGSEGSFLTFCYLNQVCCPTTTYGTWGSWQYTEYSDYSNCVQCQKSRTRTATRSRTKTVTNQDCSQVTTAESETKTFTTPAAISGETCTDCVEYQNCCCPTSVTYTNKQYTGSVTYGSCQFVTGEGNRIEKRTHWTATKTTTNSDCSQTVENNVAGFDSEYVACCTAGCTESNKQYTGVVTYDNCIQGQRAKKTWYTATETCIDSSCNVTSTQTVSRFDVDYVACCTAGCTVSGKTYTADWSAYSNCVQGERSRSRPWSATETCTNSSCVVTTTQITGYDFEYAACCTAGCTTGTKTYSDWSAYGNCIQGERARYRTWSATETCTNSSCVVTTSTVTGTEFEYTGCCTASTTCTTGTRTYSAWGDWSNCVQGEQSRVRSWSEVTTCTTTDTSCNVTTTNTTNTGNEFEYRNCTVSPFFPFFPPFFPFFPPFFPFFPVFHKFR